MRNQSRSVSATHRKDRAESKQKPKQGAVRIVAHGISIPKDGGCVWLWAAFDDSYNIVASKSGVRGNGYGVTPYSAQFHAVIEALGWLAVNMPNEPVRVLCDVERVVKLVNGQNRTRKPSLNLLCQTAKQFLSRTKARLEWKPSSRAKRAAVSSRRANSQDFSKAERMSHDNV